MYVLNHMALIPYIILSVRHILCSVITFHYKTWHTIVNIRFHSIYKIKLNDLEASYRTSYIILYKKLPFRVINNHVIWTSFTHPHIYRRFNYSLTLSCSGNSKLVIFLQKRPQTTCQTTISICIFWMFYNKSFTITPIFIKP